MTSRKASTGATGNIVQYRTKDGVVHWASKTAPQVVKGLDSGDLTLIEEVAPDAPKVSAPSPAPNPEPAK